MTDSLPIIPGIEEYVAPNEPEILISQIDGSVNHVYEDGSEFRLVTRSDHETVYLSSHTGCGLGCKQCHLTSTGQTKMVPLSSFEMMDRALTVWDPYSKSRPKPRHVNFSFMARGDALANPAVNGTFSRQLLQEASLWTHHARINVSTIFPRKSVGEDVGQFLFDRFGSFPPTLYWSLYTMDEEKRNYWMPEAQDPTTVGKGLLEYQNATFQDVIIHLPLIKDVNDTEEDVYRLRMFLFRTKLRYKLNLVRYNPPDSTSEEAAEEAYDLYRVYFTNRSIPVKMQPRVGFDVKASCGMFTNQLVEKDETV